ncbi:MAG: NAD-dependent epimerase/dehydratase family protein [Frankiales bacterium]|nr:NAD-dependent epimerase/dehydratase family protein [Frankiales bacterium]
MRILVLGGTAFVGRAIAAEALGRGDEVTLFGRGRTGVELFPQAARRVGDRATGDYASLAGTDWDAVVDVSAYVPRHVQQAAAVLTAGRCLLISTGSVYDHTRSPGVVDEDAPRLAPERETEDHTGRAYGPLKVACEDDLARLWGERGTVVRPGIVAGPHDPTDRFTWWVRRAARGGRVALPGRPDQPSQVVDSSDLARLVVQLLHDDRPGTYNAVGPAEPVTLQTLIEACAQGAGSSVQVVPVEADVELPLVVRDEAWWPFMRRSADRARAVGLTATPLAQTAADVLAWDRERGEPPLAVELSPEREAELLAG